MQKSGICLVGAVALWLTVSAAAQVQPENTEQELSDPLLAAKVALGRDAFTMCDGCHSIRPGGPSAAGPNLYGVVGRKAGSVADYPYTNALIASDITWDAQSLDAYLADPGGYVPGSEMERGAVRDTELRKAIVAFLASISE